MHVVIYMYMTTIEDKKWNTKEEREREKGVH